MLSAACFEQVVIIVCMKWIGTIRFIEGLGCHPEIFDFF